MCQLPPARLEAMAQALAARPPEDRADWTPATLALLQLGFGGREIHAGLDAALARAELIGASRAACALGDVVAAWGRDADRPACAA